MNELTQKLLANVKEKPRVLADIDVKVIRVIGTYSDVVRIEPLLSEALGYDINDRSIVDNLPLETLSHGVYRAMLTLQLTNPIVLYNSIEISPPFPVLKSLKIAIDSYNIYNIERRFFGRLNELYDIYHMGLSPEEVQDLVINPYATYDTFSNLRDFVMATKPNNEGLDGLRAWKMLFYEDVVALLKSLPE